MTPLSLSHSLSPKARIVRSYRGFGTFGISILIAGFIVGTGCSSTRTTTLKTLQPLKELLWHEQSTIETVDPARTPYHGWKPVDIAIARAAIELLIIARPADEQEGGISEREYSLRTVRGTTGTLKVTRRGVGIGVEPSQGLTIECRIGHSDDRDLERELLAIIDAELREEQLFENE